MVRGLGRKGYAEHLCTAEWPFAGTLLLLPQQPAAETAVAENPLCSELLSTAMLVE